MIAKLLSLLLPRKPKNPEQFLVLELQDVVSGKKPRTEVWKSGWGAAHTLDPKYFGSCNIPLLGQAVALWATEGDKTHIIDDWMEFFKLSQDRMFGNEAGSRIYLLWHVMAVAAVALWAENNPGNGLVAPSREWLGAAVRFMKQFVCPSGECLMVGQRSAGHPPIPGVLDWVLAVATKGDEARAEQWCKQAGAGLRQHVEWVVYGPQQGRKAAGPLRDTLQRAGREAEQAAPHKTVPEYYFYRGDGIEGTSFAAWTPRTVNPNTGSILGVIWAEVPTGATMVQWFPANGGAHIREQFDAASIKRDGDKLVYDSPLYGHQEGAL